MPWITDENHNLVPVGSSLSDDVMDSFVPSFMPTVTYEYNHFAIRGSQQLDTGNFQGQIIFDQEKNQLYIYGNHKAEIIKLDLVIDGEQLVGVKVNNSEIIPAARKEIFDSIVDANVQYGTSPTEIQNI